MNQLIQHAKFDVQKMIEVLPDPIFIKDMDGAFVHCNSSFAEIIGIDSEKIIGVSVAEISRPEFSKACKASDSYLLSGKALKRSYFCYVENKRTNERFHAQLIKSIYLEACGKPLGFVAVVRSVRKNIAGEMPVGLSPREINILRLVAEGMTQKNISANLNISPHTTAHHMKSIFLKMKVKNKVAAISAAQYLGFI